MNHPDTNHWLQPDPFTRPNPGSLLDEIERTDGSVIDYFDGLDLEMLEEEYREIQ